jgi:hypothetical protein
MKKLTFLVSIILASCVFQSPPPNTDPENCAKACEKIGPSGLGCPEGEPLEDGTSCTKFCEDTQNSGHPLNAGCFMSKVQKCSDIAELCGQ